MSAVNLGGQEVSLIYHAAATANNMNKMLRGLIKPGIYSGGVCTGVGTSNITIAAFRAAFNSSDGVNDDKMVNIITSQAIILAGSSGVNNILYMTYTYDLSAPAYIDFAWGSVAPTNAITLCTVSYSGTVITAISEGTKSLGLFDSSYNMYCPSPVIFGGSLTTSSLILKATTGVGTTGSDLIFQVGNNGATEAMRILVGGNVGIGIAAPTHKLHVVSTASGSNQYGIYSAQTSYDGTTAAIYGCASACNGVYGYSVEQCGVNGCADSYGVYGKATTTYGVYGYANCSAIHGESVTDYGVEGYACCSYGVVGNVCCCYGVYGIAHSCYGVCGHADICYGVYGNSTCRYGVYGQANCNFGVFGQSSCIGICGVANSCIADPTTSVCYGCYGVMGIAGCYGVYGCASSCVGQTCGCYGVYGHADESFAVAGNTAYCQVSNKYLKYKENICLTDCIKQNPIKVYKYLWEDTNIKSFNYSVSPLAQDFSDTFKLTDYDDGISGLDGVAFGLAVELLERIELLENRIKQLEEIK